MIHASNSKSNIYLNSQVLDILKNCMEIIIVYKFQFVEKLKLLKEYRKNNIYYFLLFFKLLYVQLMLRYF